MDTTVQNQSTALSSTLVPPEQKTLVSILLEATGRMISKKKRVPFWVSAAVICIGIMVVGFGISYLLNEQQAFGKKVLLVQILGVALAYASLIIFFVYALVLTGQLTKNILNDISSKSGKDGLQNWLKMYCNIRLHTIFCVVYGLTLGVYSAQSIVTVNQIHNSIGITILTCLVAFIWGIPMYWLFVLLALPIQLGQYEYHLFKADPGSSPVITHLSGIFMGLTYLYGVVAMGTMAYLAYAGLLTPSFWYISILVAWLPIILLFIAGQWALRNIVTQGRLHSLKEIQEQIARIQQEENLSDKDTMEKVCRLLEYHDRIKGSKNPTINLHSGIDFLNSLLLPVIGAIIGNIDAFLKMFTPLRDFFNK